MIDTRIFNIKGAVRFYVVGTPYAVHDLLTYMDHHAENDTLNLKQIMDCLRFHKVYCYAMALTPVYLPAVIIFKKELKDAGRWINLDGFAEAYYLAHPDTALEELPFSLDDVLNVVLNNNPWIALFDVDIDDVIRRLQEHSDNGT